MYDVANTSCYGVVYLAQNKLNGKAYVGQTKAHKLSYRIKAHASQKRLCYFQRALAKYGADGFNWTILDTADTKHGLSAAESYWISYLDTTNPLMGYNLSLGGESGSRGYKWTEQQVNASRKRPIRCVETGEIFRGPTDVLKYYGVCATGRNPRAGGYHWEYVAPSPSLPFVDVSKPCPIEHKQRQQLAYKQHVAELTTRNGRITKAKLKQAPLAKNAVYCIDINKYFFSAAAANKYFGISTVSDHLNGRFAKAGGYLWRRVPDTPMILVEQREKASVQEKEDQKIAEEAHRHEVFREVAKRRPPLHYIRRCDRIKIQEAC